MSTAVIEAFAVARSGVEPAPLAHPLRFSVPNLDTGEFMELKAKRRHEIQLTLRILERVHALRGERNFVDAVQVLAASYRHIRGLSGSSLRRKYADYVAAAGNWRALIKGYRAPSAQPEEFRQFVRGLMERNGRSMAAALEELRTEIWPGGASVPGYGTWQEWFAARHPTQAVPARFPQVWPEGWTVRNLRRFGPSRAERKIFTQGLGAAHGDLPVIRRDTAKLRPMEWIVIDDFRLDHQCAFAGDPARGIKPQIAEVAGLLAMCVGTRKKLARLLGPLVEREVKRPDGTVEKVRCNIRAVDVQVLLYQVFERHGLPKDYEVTILCENAAASIGKELELMLSTLFEGRIRVVRTSLIEHKTLANGFVENGGTPWEKGWIESEFNFLWNKLNTFKGHKGSNERLNGPAWLDDERRYALKLIGAGAAAKLNLPPELVAELRLPFASMAELEIAFDRVVELSERRTQHRFNGFDVVTEWRWPTPALPAPEGIDPHAPNSFRALALLSPEQQRQVVLLERKQSALERWEHLSALHPRLCLKAGALALLLLTPKKAKWRRHCVTFTHEKVGYSYVDEGNVMAGIPEGTEVLAYVDFAAPEVAVVAQLDGKPIGSLRMLGNSPRGVDITDPAAMDEARALRAKIVNRVLAEVRARPLHQAADAQLAADRAHNDAVVTAFAREVGALPVAEQTAASRDAVRPTAQPRATRSASAPTGLEQISDDKPDETSGGRPNLAELL